MANNNMNLLTIKDISNSIIDQGIMRYIAQHYPEYTIKEYDIIMDKDTFSANFDIHVKYLDNSSTRHGYGHGTYVEDVINVDYTTLKKYLPIEKFVIE